MNSKELNDFLKDKSPDFISGLLFGVQISKEELKATIDAQKESIK